MPYLWASTPACDLERKLDNQLLMVLDAAKAASLSITSEYPAGETPELKGPNSVLRSTTVENNTKV